MHDALNYMLVSCNNWNIQESMLRFFCYGFWAEKLLVSVIGFRFKLKLLGQIFKVQGLRIKHVRSSGL